jgi:transposase
MVQNKEIVRRVTEMVIARLLTRADAADLLETSVRTISNYKRRYTTWGPSGLIDGRHGNYRKLNAEAERQIVECKITNAARSASWIRRRLKLDVTSESVRRVLVKHGLNRHNKVSRKQRVYSTPPCRELFGPRCDVIDE